MASHPDVIDLNASDLNVLVDFNALQNFGSALSTTDNISHISDEISQLNISSESIQTVVEVASKIFSLILEILKTDIRILIIFGAVVWVFNIFIWTPSIGKNFPAVLNYLISFSIVLSLFSIWGILLIPFVYDVLNLG